MGENRASVDAIAESGRAPAGATTAGNGKVTVSTTAPAEATTAGNGKVTVSTTTPAGATTTDPFSCASRATGDNIPREYTHPSHCKEYYWCVNGAPINRTCSGSSLFIANATQSLACTTDYRLSFCALKSSSSPGATTAGYGNVTVSTTAPPSKCDCSTYAYIARANTYPGNCSQYYRCVNGMKISQECGSGHQVYFNISEDAIPCTNIPSDYYCKHVEDGNLQPCA
ncbi:uncharacterized protein [Haliotis cracherodii]|uniref:uncharacterized protein n=1 Tax=Haliotis cracherodii TaxID=6455 RepID=UPI0039E8FC02